MPILSGFRTSVLCGFLLSLLGSQASAQSPPTNTPGNAPDPGQQERRQQYRERLESERLQRRPDVRLPGPAAGADSRLPADESPCFVLQTITLQGDPAGHFSWILDALGGPQGEDRPQLKCIGAQGIALLVQRAQQALIDRGFVTSRVLTEPQDFKSGHLVLTLLPGRIHAIRFAPDTAARATASNAVPARPGDILNLRDIEQALENFKRLPSAEVEIQIEPAEAPGTSDLVISWK